MQNAEIFVFDNSATVTIDDCKNCVFFIAPSKGSIFIRDCTDCKAIMACQQFRSRDCKNLHVSLCCQTLPIIESTSNIHFACFQAGYFQLLGQFTAAGLSIYNNSWYKIHDFSPSKETPNYTLHKYVANESPQWVSSFFALPTPLSEFAVETSGDASTVPLSIGNPSKTADGTCLVVLFHPAFNNAKKVVKSIRSSSSVRNDLYR